MLRLPSNASAKRSRAIGEHHDGDFGVYMSHKIQKLRQENETLRRSVLCSQLFAQIVIFVNGYTSPSKEELRRLIIQHGGDFEHYQTPRVTHIIATHIPLAKLRQSKKARNPIPIVIPEWIVQCVAQSKILALKSFLYHGIHDSTQDTLYSSFNLSKDSLLSASNEEEASVDLAQSSVKEMECDPPPFTHQAEDAIVKKRTNSSKGGPEFLKSFFAKSRLHHIGTWRTRFQQRAQEFEKLYTKAPMHRESPQSDKRVILHVDMDCFFVAIAIKCHRLNRELESKPVAVAHSSNAGSSEISSCNYLARSFGLRAGMFMNTARELCPDLVVLPYSFDAIEEASMDIYAIFFQHTPFVQAMSCDEACLEFGSQVDGAAKADEIRDAILHKTKCTASVGISYNLLLAKLATGKAKPNGVCHIATREQADEFLLALDVKDLPGVGKRAAERLDSFNIHTVRHVRDLTKRELAEKLGGTKLGESLYQFARGIDHRCVSMEANLTRKSVSAVVNFGIRFEKWQDSVDFLTELAKVVQRRLQEVSMLTRSITLQVKKRKKDEAIEPLKYMGCGRCDDYSKTQVLAEATDEDVAIARVAIHLLHQFRFADSDLRGIGLLATKLVRKAPKEILGTDSEVSTKQDTLRNWMSSTHNEHVSAPSPYTNSEQRAQKAEITEKSLLTSAAGTKWKMPSMSQIDKSILQELPTFIQTEILNAYANPIQIAPKQTKKRPQRVKKPRKRSTAKAPSQKRPNFFFRPAEVSDGLMERNSSESVALNDVSFSQVDTQVYKQLPLAIRNEVNRYTKPSRSTNPQHKLATESSSGFQASNNRALGSLTEPNRSPVPSISKLVLEALDQIQSPAIEFDSMWMQSQGINDIFDAVHARILFEVETHALDKVLHMLRYMRRSCSKVIELLQRRSHDVICEPIPEEFATDCVKNENKRIGMICKGFNQILARVNEEIQARYNGTLASRLIAPLQDCRTSA
uniref:DNA repair protein REV1 n=1 Tax=Albugo laibachii Nc14 TaxID=890382 RepID=F0WAZ2_9STRA|nr:DNA repair protein REV1 putative [Albugo laibachii Nc14]CCA18413.1 DNA repair protein REV1 putative [Albugo laibachii Nc14]|eukprot:CCA18413.1 DNA repair protein REV1 putative [Albugo laibachii Nc14]